MKASKAEKPAKSDKSKKSEKDAKLKKSKKDDKKGVEVKAKAADAPKVPEKKAQPKAAAKPAQAVKAPSKPKADKVASAADAGALDPRITNREFKLLLNPEGLDRRNKVMQLDSLVVSFARQCGLEFFHLDNANTGLRNVYFFDTPGEDLRHANLILRVRESRQNVWVDDWCEVTFKCRAHDFETAAAFDPTPNVPHRNRMRFKEEILRGDGIGSSRQIFSNNAVLDSVPDVKYLGHPTERLPGNVSFTVRYIEGESMLLQLDTHGYMVSSGSACASGSLEPSHVILALGLGAEEAHGSLRVSLGRENTDEEIDGFVEVFPPIVEKLRQMSPLYVKG